MLQRETIDTGGRPVSATGFSELRVPRDGTAGPARSARPALLWEDRLETAELDGLRRRGWPAPTALPGRLVLYDARRSGPETAGGGGIVHLSYSDGIEAVSVFVQRGDLDESDFTGWARTESRGRTVFRRDALQHWAVWERGGHVFTVLTDAPRGTADSVVAALPGGEGAFRARLGRGFRRMLSWIDPSG
jgi:sigma-E factor negative regulatory protein RseB